MKKITMLMAVALACTTFAFAADDSAPQNELHMQAPQVAVQQQATVETAPMDENAAVALPEAPVQPEEPATPSETPVDEEMLVTPEAPSEEGTGTEEQLPAEDEAAGSEVQPPIEENVNGSEEPAIPSETPVDEEMLVTPEQPADQETTEPEAEKPEEQIPDENGATEPEEQLPAEEEQVIVEIPENEIPVAAAPVTITIRGIVYNGEEIAYQEEQTVETAVGEILELDSYVWTETLGITFTGSAGEVTVSADTTEYVLAYELEEGWVIL